MTEPKRARESRPSPSPRAIAVCTDCDCMDEPLDEQEAALAVEMAMTQARENLSLPAGPRELRAICQHVLDSPEMICEEWRTPFLQIFQKHLDRNPPQKGGAEAIAVMVEWATNGRKCMSLTQACEYVAGVTGREFGAVKQSHFRCRRDCMALLQAAIAVAVDRRQCRPQ
jgi:hypothetical protein